MKLCAIPVVTDEVGNSQDKRIDLTAADASAKPASAEPPLSAKAVSKQQGELRGMKLCAIAVFDDVGRKRGKRVDPAADEPATDAPAEPSSSQPGRETNDLEQANMFQVPKIRHHKFKGETRKRNWVTLCLVCAMHGFEGGLNVDISNVKVKAAVVLNQAPLKTIKLTNKPSTKAKVQH